jgi:TonB family protein
VRVAVRVRIDPSGAVVDAKPESHAGSRYFERVALDAARRWRFKPASYAGHNVESVWRVRFEFQRTGCVASSDPVQR